MGGLRLGLVDFKSTGGRGLPDEPDTNADKFIGGLRLGLVDFKSTGGKGVPDEPATNADTLKGGFREGLAGLASMTDPVVCAASSKSPPIFPKFPTCPLSIDMGA